MLAGTFAPEPTSGSITLVTVTTRVVPGAGTRSVAPTGIWGDRRRVTGPRSSPGGTRGVAPEAEIVRVVVPHDTDIISPAAINNGVRTRFWPRKPTGASVARGNPPGGSGPVSQFDPGKTEATLRTYLGTIGLASSKIESISCPSGVDSKVGATFNCSVTTTDGHHLKLNVTQTDKQVHLQLH
jgi:hypothetical protein